MSRASILGRLVATRKSRDWGISLDDLYVLAVELYNEATEVGGAGAECAIIGYRLGYERGRSDAESLAVAEVIAQAKATLGREEP